MFGLSGEHLLILAGVLLIFGPRKLPELGSSVGKALRNFREGLNQPQNSGSLEARNVTPQPAAQQASAAPAAEPVTRASAGAPETSTTS